MGNNYLEKSLKRFFKRKIKITMGIVVAFLITGNIGLASTVVENIQERENRIFSNSIPLETEVELPGIGKILVVEINEKLPVYTIRNKHNGFLKSGEIKLDDKMNVKVEIGDIVNNQNLIGKIDEININKNLTSNSVNLYEFNELLNKIAAGTASKEDFNISGLTWEYIEDGTLKLESDSSMAIFNINYNLGNGIGIYGKNEASETLFFDDMYFDTSSIKIGKIKNNNLISGTVTNINNNFNVILSSIIANIANSNIGNGIGIFSGSSYSYNFVKNNKIEIDKIENFKEISGKIETLKTGITFANSDTNMFSNNSNIGNGIGVLSRLESSAGEHNIALKEGIFNNKGGKISGKIDKIEISLNKNLSNLENPIIEIKNQNLGNGIGIGTFDKYNSGKGLITIGNIINEGTIEGNVAEMVFSSNFTDEDIIKNINLGNGIGIYVDNGDINLENIKNINGKISGQIDNTYRDTVGGNGIEIYSGRGNITVGNIENINGKISGYIKNMKLGSLSGNGLIIKTDTINNLISMGKIENSGIISGKVDSITDTNISAFSSLSGNGIVLSGQLEMN